MVGAVMQGLIADLLDRRRARRSARAAARLVELAFAESFARLALALGPLGG